MSVRHSAVIIAASTLAFTLEFVWAPIVDSSLTRRIWYVVGAAVMCGCLAELLIVPWDAASLPLLTALAFVSSSGASIAAAAAKGLMAYDVPRAQLGSASGFYTAGGIFAKAVGGAGTLWLLTHSSDRTSAAGLSVGCAALAGAAILLTLPGRPVPWREFPEKLRQSVVDLWGFVRRREGVIVAVLCVIPFGAGTEAGLIGAIAHEWDVTPDKLAVFSVLAAATGITGAIFSGWLSTRVGPWKVYVLLGWTMIAVILGLAFAPRTLFCFLVLELFYRALASGCYAALLGIVMTAIGKGAASTKAAGMWSLANFAVVYPALLEGSIHDSVGTRAMLLTDAGLGAVGFAMLLVACRLLKLSVNPSFAPGTLRVRRE